MKVINHRGGSLELYGVRLAAGDNTIDDAAWAAAYGKLPDALKKAFFGGEAPMLSLVGEPAKQRGLPLTPLPEPEPGPEPEPEQLLAKEAIILVEAATEPEQLEALAAGETRKTVLAAIKKRAAQLAEAAA